MKWSEFYDWINEQLVDDTTFYATYDSPFWSNTNNLPNLDLLQSLINEYFFKSTFKINYVNNNLIQLNFDWQEPKPFKYIIKKSSAFAGKLAFYKLVDNYLVQNFSYMDNEEEVSNDEGTRIYNYVLDDNMTNNMFMFWFLVDSGVNMYANRTHEWNNEMMIAGDNNIDNIPKPYNLVNVQKNYFPSGTYDGKTLYWNDSFNLVNPENNAYKYMVFNDGPNGTYTIFPIIGETKNCSIIKPVLDSSTKIYESTFTHGDYKYKGDNREYQTSISDEINTKVNEAYLNGWVVKYFRHRLKDNVSWIDNFGWYELNTPYGTYPIDINSTCSYWTQTPGFDAVSATTTVMGNQVYTFNGDGITAGNWGSSWNRTKKMAEFKIEIHQIENSNKGEEIAINNAYQTLVDNIIKSSEFSNKYVGIFAGPHLLNFKWTQLSFKEISGKKYLQIVLPANGIDITPFNIYNYNYYPLQAYNNYNNQYIYLLKYLKLNYYNRDINACLRLSENGGIYIGGKLVFSDGFYLLSKNSNQVANQNSIISYGGMLPTSRDEYFQQVMAKRNTIDTSYYINAQKNEYDNLAKGLSLPIDFYKNYNEMGANIASAFTGFTHGNVDQTAKGVSSAMNTMVDTQLMPFKLMSSIFKKNREMRYERLKMQAQFKDQNISLGNNINMSNVVDASIMNYYESDGDQYECVEVYTLNENVIKLLNNYLFSYGFAWLNKFSLDTKRMFQYVEINEQWLTNWFNSPTSFGDSSIWNSLIENFIQFATNGFRIIHSNKDNHIFGGFSTNEINTLFIDDLDNEDIALKYERKNIPYIEKNDKPPQPFSNYTNKVLYIDTIDWDASYGRITSVRIDRLDHVWVIRVNNAPIANIEFKDNEQWSFNLTFNQQSKEPITYLVVDTAGTNNIIKINEPSEVNEDTNIKITKNNDDTIIINNYIIKNKD